MSSTIIFVLLNLCLSVNLIRSHEDSSAADTNVFHKCCPNSMELNIIVNSDNLITYECMPISHETNQSNRMFYNKTYNILFDSYKPIVDKVVLNTSDDEYNIGESNLIPKCENLKNYRIIEFNDKHNTAFVPISNYCTDLINSRIVLLYCGEFNNNLIKVNKINKCCPRDYYFDKSENECRIMDKQQIEGGLLKSYVKNFNNLLKNDLNLFSSGPPKCAATSEYVVEYTTKSHHLTIDNNSLRINGTLYDSNLSENNFCVELVYDKHALFDADTSYELIVQVCHDSTICTRMPCVYKCCRFGEKMVKDSTDTPNYCAPYYKTISPTFHAMDDLDLYNKDYTPQERGVHGKIMMRTMLTKL